MRALFLFVDNVSFHITDVNNKHHRKEKMR